MQLQLKAIQHDLGTTFVYVTHDQEEALAMSDRIAVMNGGRVEQIGSPREIYERPETAFVADFIGSLSVLELTVDEVVGEYAVTRLGEGERVIVAVGPDTRRGDAVRVAVRPEQVQLEPVDDDAAPEGESRLEGTIAEIVFLGMYTQFHVETRAGRRDLTQARRRVSGAGSTPGRGSHSTGRRSMRRCSAKVRSRSPSSRLLRAAVRRTAARPRRLPRRSERP